MCIHSDQLASVAAAFALALRLGAAPATAAPAPAPPAMPQAASPNGPPAEIGKIVLGDTSVDGPAIWAGSRGVDRVVIAWTGTDGAGHLNVMVSTAGAHYSGKLALGETSSTRPAVVRMGEEANAPVAIAWTGTDAAHHLNVATVAPWPSLPCTPPAGVGRADPTLIVRGTTSSKRVTLSLDAGGEDSVRSGSLLDTLNAKGVRSTWFLEGEWTQDHPDIVQRVVNEGHEIGNHTVDHPDLMNPPRSNASICAELGLADQIAWSWTGKATRPFFRPPYGAYNGQVLNTAADFGYRTVYWTIDPRDWDPNVTAQNILDTVKQNLQPGAIVLMHAGSLHEPEALGLVIDYIQSQGYTIVPLSTLLT